jgi:DNA-binding transcriptional MerR regulator
VEQIFRSETVAAISGASFRQLQWWDEQKLVGPKQKTGHRRKYDYEDLLKVCLIRRMRALGLSLQTVRRMLPRLTASLRDFDKDSENFALMSETARRIEFKSSAEEAIRHMARTPRGFFVIPIHEEAGRINRSIEKLS